MLIRIQSSPHVNKFTLFYINPRPIPQPPIPHPSSQALPPARLILGTFQRNEPPSSFQLLSPPSSSSSVSPSVPCFPCNILFFLVFFIGTPLDHLECPRNVHDHVTSKIRIWNASPASYSPHGRSHVTHFPRHTRNVCGARCRGYWTILLGSFGLLWFVKGHHTAICTTMYKSSETETNGSTSIYGLFTGRYFTHGELPLIIRSWDGGFVSTSE